MDWIGPSPNLSVIHTVTIGTMLNLNGGNNGHGLKTVTCKQTLRIGFSRKFETIRDSGNIAQQQARVSKGFVSLSFYSKRFSPDINSWKIYMYNIHMQSPNRLLLHIEHRLYIILQLYALQLYTVS